MILFNKTVDIRNVKKKSDKVIRISPEEKRNLMDGILKNIENQPLIKNTGKGTWQNVTNVKDLSKQKQASDILSSTSS